MKVGQLATPRRSRQSVARLDNAAAYNNQGVRSDLSNTAHTADRSELMQEDSLGRW